MAPGTRRTSTERRPAVLRQEGGLFVWGIFLTHKVAGPLFVILNNLEKLVANGKVLPRPIRKGDEFQDYYEEIRRLLEKLSVEDPGAETEQRDG